MINKQNSPPGEGIQLIPLPKNHLINALCSDPLQDYISKEEFMIHFGIKRGLYYKLLSNGKLKIYNVGSKAFLRRSEIDRALKNNLLK